MSSRSVYVDEPPGVREQLFQVRHLVSVVPYGVLGSQRQAGNVTPVADEPQADGAIVIVDPAGLHHIQARVIGNAGGAAGSVYLWLGLDTQNQPFPIDVVRHVTAPTHARLYNYSGRAVIHAVGPDLRRGVRQTREDDMDALDLLSKTYSRVFSEFGRHVASVGSSVDCSTLRLPPISSGIFAGPFRPAMPALSVCAINRALGTLDAETLALVSKANGVELCIFERHEFQSYQRAWQVG